MKNGGYNMIFHENNPRGLNFKTSSNGFYSNPQKGWKFGCFFKCGVTGWCPTFRPKKWRDWPSERPWFSRRKDRQFQLENHRKKTWCEKNGEIDQPWVNDGKGQKKTSHFSPDQIMKVSWLHHSRCLLLVCQCDDRAALKIPTRSAVWNTPRDL